MRLDGDSHERSEPGTGCDLYEVTAYNSLGLFYFIFLFEMFVFVGILPTCISAYHMGTVPLAARRGRKISWDQSYTWL